MSIKKNSSESKVIIENGKVKTIYSEEIRRTGYMTVEQSKNLTLQRIAKTRELMKQQNANNNQ